MSKFVQQILLFISVFIISGGVLLYTAYITGLIPSELLGGGQTEPVKIVGDNEVPLKTVDENQQTDFQVPTRVFAPHVDIDVAVINPSSSSYEVLNNELARGAVYYPGSGTIGQGNMFLFGHSSGLKNVINQNYKAFNGVKKLTAGDDIFVEHEGNVFRYEVQTVIETSENDEYVTFASSKPMLTISTCNVFGSKDRRYVAKALYKGKVETETADERVI